MLISALAAGCGSDEQPGAIQGTVEGRTLGPIRSAYATMSSARALSVVLDEGGTSCAQRSDGAEKLAIIFPCPLREGEHAVVYPPSGPQDCSGAAVANAVLEAGSGFDIAGATGGRVTLTSTGDPLTGDFDLSFDGPDRLRGSFEASRCPSN